jgi:hypothetical protein
MKRLSLLIAMSLIIPVVAYASETSMLYYKNRIDYGGVQITKGYYIKESLKRVDSKNPKILQVKTHTTVTAPEGAVKYRSTLQVNCETNKFNTVKHWSSGFGEDRGLIVDGKWHDLADFDDSPLLAKKICPKK